MIGQSYRFALFFSHYQDLKVNIVVTGGVSMPKISFEDVVAEERPLTGQMSYQAIDRRSFIVSGAAVASSLALTLLGSKSADARSRTYEEAVEEVLKGAKPTADMIILKMPEIAENGNVVAISIDATAAEAAGKTVKALHVYATDNPWPYVATFHLTPQSGKAIVTSRMRLARSQKVVAVAALESDEFLITETFVKVTIGGCGG